MSDLPILLPLYLTSLVSSFLLFLGKRSSLLRGSIALLFVIGIVAPFLFSWLIEIRDLYDHGMPGEFLQTTQFLCGWTLLVITLSFLSARKEPSLSIVFPILWSTTALLVMVVTTNELQLRSDRSYYFEYYSEIMGASSAR
jgi:hypothetical protein